MANRRFYIVNDSSSTVHLSTFHLGCGGVPWLDGLPRCNTQAVPPGATQYYEPSSWVIDFDLILSVFVDIVAIAGEIAVAVLTEGAAVPAEEESVEAMVGEFWASVEEATGEEATSIISKLTEASSENFASLASKLGTTPERLGSIMKSIGMGSATIGAGVMLDKLLPEWKFFLTNETSNVWQPRAAIIDPQTTNVIYTVTDAALTSGMIIFEHDGWIRRSTDDVSVWWSGDGIESLPGFSPTSPRD